VLPNRELVLLAGDPGVGKSQIAISMAAAITTGNSWPTTTTNAPLGKVIYIGTEDPADTVIKPRLQACGADPSNVAVLSTVSRGDQLRAFSLKEDIPKLERVLAHVTGVRLVIIDTLGNHMGGADRNKAEEVRAITSQLTALARKHSLCVVGITHLKKGEGSALQRVMGSIDWTAAARATWVVDKDDDSDQRKMLPAKMNTASDQTGYAFKVETVYVDDIKTSKVLWESGTFLQTANQRLREKQDSENPTKIQEAKEFLRVVCPMASKEIVSKAKGMSISKRTLDRAKSQLRGFSEWSQEAQDFIWTLPVA
jgi:DNA replicative helicase MCM subunit Mcm2 (Cdc46/Mcm family)